MPNIETYLLNRESTVSSQDLHNARLNPFAVELLVEAYRQIVKETGKTYVFRFAFDGVAISLQPFIPGTADDMKANENGPTQIESSPGPTASPASEI